MGKFLIRGIATFIGLAALTAAPAKTLLSIPLKIDSAKIADYAVIREMYAEALGTAYAGTVKNAALAEPCADRECATFQVKACAAGIGRAKVEDSRINLRAICRREEPRAEIPIRRVVTFTDGKNAGFKV